jgi:hypothetical protein
MRRASERDREQSTQWREQGKAIAVQHRHKEDGKVEQRVSCVATREREVGGWTKEEFSESGDFFLSTFSSDSGSLFPRTEIELTLMALEPQSVNGTLTAAAVATSASVARARDMADGKKLCEKNRPARASGTKNGDALGSVFSVVKGTNLHIEVGLLAWT